MEEIGKAIGMALSYGAGICGSDIILLGGWVSKAGKIVTDVIQKYYKEYVFYAAKDTPIQLSALGNGVGIYGAAKMIID